MNIWSGSKGWVAALTNPTHIAVRKGNLAEDMPIIDKNGKTWRNVEYAYKAYKTGDLDQDIAIMTRIIRTKLEQYPWLIKNIEDAGGVVWLETCWHQTGARFSRWEGKGRDSAFIRALITAYEEVI